MVNPADIPKQWDIMKIRMFKTYIGAAIEAHSLGLLSLAGVIKVLLQTAEDLHCLHSWYPKWTDEKNYVEEVIIDMDQCKTLCKDKRLLKLINHQIEIITYLQQNNECLRNYENAKVSRTVSFVHKNKLI